MIWVGWWMQGGGSAAGWPGPQMIPPPPGGVGSAHRDPDGVSDATGGVYPRHRTNSSEVDTRGVAKDQVLDLRLKPGRVRGPWLPPPPPKRGFLKQLLARGG